MNEQEEAKMDKQDIEDIKKAVFNDRYLCRILGINYIPPTGKFSEDDVAKVLKYMSGLQKKE